MSDMQVQSGEERRTKPPRRRHWRRWTLAGLLALVVVAVVAVAVTIVAISPSQPPLALPAGTAAAPAGQLDGTWQVTTGSVAGFRVRESTLGFGNDVTGRTSEVSGTAVVTGQQLTRATFLVSPGSIKVNGKTQPQLAKSLQVAVHPVVTVTLLHPVTLPAAFSSGATITETAAVSLTLNGITRTVTMSLSARRDGTAIQAAGALPVTFASFDIKQPSGYGAFGSLATHGTAEFLLVLAPVAAG